MFLWRLGIRDRTERITAAHLLRITVCVSMEHDQVPNPSGAGTIVGLREAHRELVPTWKARAPAIAQKRRISARQPKEKDILDDLWQPLPSALLPPTHDTTPPPALKKSKMKADPRRKGSRHLCSNPRNNDADASLVAIESDRRSAQYKSLPHHRCLCAATRAARANHLTSQAMSYLAASPARYLRLEGI